MNPIFARHLYFGLQFLRGEPVRKALDDVLETEFWSADALRQLQAERMIAQLRFVASNVPYYEKVYASFLPRIANLSSWDEVSALMKELHVVSKDLVQSAYNQFLARDIEKMRIYPDKTSGSTGTPLKFPCDQKAWAYRHALMYRNMMMHGVHVGDPYVIFFGLHWDKTMRTQVELRDWFFNRVRVSAFDISMHTFHDYLKKIRSHCPVFFLGYPSAISDFCHLALEFGIDLRELGLKAVFTTAEPLLPDQRDLIQETTGCKCVNQYGSAEGGFTAFECPEGNLHLNVESAWLHLQDPSAPEGGAVVTDMFLRAFPLINYGIEDEISLGNEACTCGRTHPILRSVNGRSGEPITLPNGKRINANLPSYIFKPLADLRVIQRYRFVQKDKELKLFLIISQRFSEEHLKLIDKETKKAFGNDIQYTTQIVTEMEVLPNAKHKCFVVLPDNAL